MSHPTPILDAIVRAVDTGRPAALCVIVATKGSTPQPTGAMLCVNEQAQITGTIGGGCVEAEILGRAHQALSMRQSKLYTFELDQESASDEGMVCGGQMDVAISVISQPEQADVLRESIVRIRAGEATVLPVQVQTPGGLVEYRISLEAPPKLVIAGGGHIGKALAVVMVPLGFRISVIDDRSRFASATRLLPPIEPVVGDIAKTLSDWPIDANTYIVIVTRGHKHDEHALGAVLDSPAKYIGMIGSRRKIIVTFNDLKQRGATQDQLDRIHAPIGLDISAITPEEIAISVAAELVSVRRANCRGTVEGPIPVVNDVT